MTAKSKARSNSSAKSNGLSSKINSDRFKVDARGKIKLKDWATCIDPLYSTHEEHHLLLDEHVAELSKLQSILYASNRYALLLVFQAMDAAGKDSAIKHVMSGVNPQGCQVFSFKHPSATEQDHDFLWRTSLCLPERGRIGIFNRSHYEEVLITRVHPQILEAEGVPNRTRNDEKFWESRYDSIRNYEAHLGRNQTCILKFFLHVSKDEQRKRFLKRIDNPDKNWKITPDDIRERKYWKDYMHAYENCIGETSTKRAPWYIVPADDKANTQLIISHAILTALRDLRLEYPTVDGRRRKELKAMRKALAK